MKRQQDTTDEGPPAKIAKLLMDPDDINLSPDILRLNRLKKYVADRSMTLPEACNPNGFLELLDRARFELYNGKAYLDMSEDRKENIHFIMQKQNLLDNLLANSIHMLKRCIEQHTDKLNIDNCKTGQDLLLLFRDNLNYHLYSITDDTNLSDLIENMLGEVERILSVLSHEIGLYLFKDF